MNQAMKRRFLEKRRVLQDLVLGAFTGDDMPRRKEITYFLLSAVVFLAVSVLLLIRNPDQGLHTGTAYYMFHQLFTQFANANPAIGLTANWLIYGNVDYADNALLLPSFVLGSLVPVCRIWSWARSPARTCRVGRKLSISSSAPSFSSPSRCCC